MENYKKKIVLITGCSGFVGFHISKFLLENKWEVVGIDALTSYYDVSYKKKRQQILENFSNFKVFNEKIEKDNLIDEIFKNYRPSIVLHLAAQAGVRYSIDHSDTYLNSNLIGTHKVLEASKKYKVEHLLMASSSSVYGANKNLPFDELQKCDLPLSFYAATKKANENMAHAYSHLFSIPITMFRFFTVYGPWGRPDMALFKFAKNILEGKPIEIYNNGEMERDFTFISDLVKGIYLLIDKNPLTDMLQKERIDGDSLSSVAPFRIVNIGNSKPIKLLKLIDLIEKNLNIKSKRNFLPMQQGDVKKTWSSIKLLNKLTNFEPEISVDEGVKKFIDWFLDFYKNQNEK